MRGIIQGVLLFLIPFVLYFGWLLLVRRAAEANGEAQPAIVWRDVPWVVLSFLGVVLVAVGLMVFADLRAMKPGEPYAPARLEGGRIVPGGPVR
ncbi:MAG: DUF6111 family protein [Elioraea sp.]|nr:DUF6111 family protein [Elioraea sp.]